MRIWLCDPTYDQLVLSSDTVPLNIGYIASYLLANSRHKHNVALFKFPRDIIAAMESDLPPDLVGFTHFMWNARFSYAFACSFKRRWPGITVVFGGMNYPNEPHKQRDWLLSHPSVDFHVFKEGEFAFTNLVDRLEETSRDANILRATESLAGVHYVRPDGSVHIPEPAPRLSNLSDFPSPYVSGILDKFLDGRLMPLVSSNRGCPFTCSFCTEGRSYYNKVNKVTIARFEEEMTYLARKMSVFSEDKGRRDIYITDSNFGMYREDLEKAKIIGKLRETYSWPQFVRATTGKNKPDMILAVAKTLGGAMTITGSVQSMDKEVLTNIKRSNIRLDDLVTLAMSSKGLGAFSYSEIILGLPGDSLEKHTDSCRHLINAGFDFISMHQLALLDDAEMGSDEYRTKFGLNGRFRILTRSFGSYPLANGECVNAIEIEEVCVEGNEFPFNDYLTARLRDLIITIMYNDHFFEGILRLLDLYDIPRFSWLEKIFQLIKNYPGLVSLLDDFLEETRNELWESKDQLLQFIASPDVLQKCVDGSLGSNLLGKYRMLAICDRLNEICDVALDAVKDCLAVQMENDGRLSHLIDEIIIFERERKRDLFDENLPDTDHVFAFDISQLLISQPTESIAKFWSEDGTKFRFFRTQKARDTIARNRAIFGTTVMGRYKQMTRTPWKTVYRVAERIN